MADVEHLETTELSAAIITTIRDDKLIDERVVETIAKQLFSLADQNGGARLVLDLSRLEIACSSFLITLNKKVHATGGSLQLCGVAPRVYEYLAMTNLNEMLSIWDTRQQAFAASHKGCG